MWAMSSWWTCRNSPSRCCNVNLFALNAAELNGSIEVWSWYGDAALAVNGAGDVQKGLVAGGDAEIVTAGDLAPRLDVYGTFDTSSMAIAAYGDVILGLTVEGGAPVVVQASGTGTRWVLGSSDLQIVLETEGDGQVVQPASASFSIVVSSTLDGMVATTVREDGLGRIMISSLLNEHVAKRQMIEGEAQVHMASVGAGYLIIDSPAGYADVRIFADGDARFGDKISLEGDAVLQLYARGEVGSLHYVYGAGEAEIGVSFSVTYAAPPPVGFAYETEGPLNGFALGGYSLNGGFFVVTKTVGMEYTPAPRSRIIYVQSEPRAYRVQSESRRIA